MHYSISLLSLVLLTGFLLPSLVSCAEGEKEGPRYKNQGEEGSLYKEQGEKGERRGRRGMSR